MSAYSSAAVFGDAGETEEERDHGVGAVFTGREVQIYGRGIGSREVSEGRHESDAMFEDLDRFGDEAL